ncbi:MAG: sugar-binding domain-containing protein, partial [Ignavibacteria bacterium]
MKSKTMNLKILLFLILLTINCLGQNMNNQFSLGGDWFYKLDEQKIGIKEKWFEKNNVRYDGNLKVPDFFETQISKEFDGWLWYFREFDFSSSPEEKKLALFFEGVDDDASIWINGTFVGEHKGYSERFYFDVSQFINDGKNFITVLVSDQGGPGGIYKPVYLKYYSTEEELFETEYSKQVARKSLDWIKEGITYEIFPRSFSKEGTFKSIIKRLQYLKDLGVTILWIMPIHP